MRRIQALSPKAMMPDRNGYMAKKPTAQIMFIADYESGQTALFSIDQWTLKEGDHVAPLIAVERQKAGELPEGTIKRVRRAASR